MKTDKLTIEHLAAYVGKGVRMQSGHYLVGVYTGNSDETRMMLLSETPNGRIDWEANSDMDKMLLRPLSQLAETIEYNGEKGIPIEEIEWSNGLEALIAAIHRGHASYPCMMFLQTLHFDIFGLLESGLAEPIPSIQQ